jgi:hypothetical protein
VKDFEVGPLNCRVEAMVTAPVDRVIKELTAELAGGATGNFRSRAIRKLLVEACEAREAAKRKGARV